MESVILRNSVRLLMIQSESFDIRNVPHTCKVTIITSRPPLTSPDPIQTSHLNPYLIHVNTLTLQKLSKM